MGYLTPLSKMLASTSVLALIIHPPSQVDQDELALEDEHSHHAPAQQSLVAAPHRPTAPASTNGVVRLGSLPVSSVDSHWGSGGALFNSDDGSMSIYIVTQETMQGIKGIELGVFNEFATEYLDSFVSLSSLGTPGEHSHAVQVGESKIKTLPLLEVNPASYGAAKMVPGAKKGTLVLQENNGEVALILLSATGDAGDSYTKVSVAVSSPVISVSDSIADRK